MITEIPGLTLRVHSGGTGPAALMVPIANAVYALNGIDEIATVPELENWLGHVTEGFDPGRDVALVEVDGALVAYGWVDWVDTQEGTREFRLGGYVHPDWQSRGIGRRSRMAGNAGLQRHDRGVPGLGGVRAHGGPAAVAGGAPACCHGAAADPGSQTGFPMMKTSVARRRTPNPIT